MRRNVLRLRAALLVVVLALAAVGVSACGDDDDSASNGDDKAPRIAWLTPLVTEFVQAEETGLKRHLAKVGGSYRQFDATFDPQKQLRQCSDAITSGRYNSMIIYPVDGTAIRSCIREAEQANIPVVALEIAIGPEPNEVEPQLDGVVGSITYPGVTSAEERWPIVQDACGDADPCKIILSIAFRADPFNAAVLRRFQELAKEDGDEIVAVLETKYDNNETVKKFPTALRANRDADVYVAEADNNALTAARIARRAGRDLKIIGDGGSRLGIKGVADGTLYGTIGLWPQQMGQTAGEMLSAAINDESIETPGVNAYRMDEPQRVTKDNADEFKPEWGA